MEDAEVKNLNGISKITKKLPKEFIGNTGDGACSIKEPEKIDPSSSLDEILYFARSR